MRLEAATALGVRFETFEREDVSLATGTLVRSVLIEPCPAILVPSAVDAKAQDHDRASESGSPALPAT